MKSITALSKFTLSLLAALLLITSLSVAAASQGANFANVFATLSVITIVASVFMPRFNSNVALYNTVYRQVWTGEVLKKMKLLELYSWVAAITKDYSQYVKVVDEEVEVINLASFPAEPTVLIDTTDYPIGSEDLATNNIAISLNKYQTKVTHVSDDELYANSTKLMQNHSQAHANAIIKQKFAKGAWNICPSNAATAAMPVLLATGDDDGTGRKMLTFDDLVTFKRKLDNNEDADGAGNRILVLDTDHQNDLVMLDQKFKDQFFNYLTGKPYSMLNFSFFGNNTNPYYHTATKAKLSFGGVVTSAYRKSSMYFNTERVGKAIGSTRTYLSPASTDPANQKNQMNARHYHLITRLMNEGVGVIVSPDA